MSRQITGKCDMGLRDVEKYKIALLWRNITSLHSKSLLREVKEHADKFLLC